jgi:hypothetical protein
VWIGAEAGPTPIFGHPNSASSHGSHCPCGSLALAEIRLRCERSMGEDLQAGQDRGEIAGVGHPDFPIVPDGNNRAATLPELGLTRKEAAGLSPRRWESV